MNAPQVFVRQKPIEVEAMQVGWDNAEHVRDWLMKFGRSVDLIKIEPNQVEIRAFGSQGGISARNGQWISHDEDGFFRSWWPHDFVAYYKPLEIPVGVE